MLLLPDTKLNIELCCYFEVCHDVLLTAVGLTPGGSSAVRIYTQCFVVKCER